MKSGGRSGFVASPCHSIAHLDRKTEEGTKAFVVFDAFDVFVVFATYRNMGANRS